MSTRIAVLRQGKLQQLGTPNEVYRFPANLFIADFIGNPKINLLDARATRVEGGTRLDLGAFQLDCVPVNAEGSVVAAIRPEDVYVSAAPDATGVEFSVYSVLPAGSETILQARRDNLTLVVKETRSLAIEMDRPVWLTCDARKINLYDKTTGNLVTPARGATEGGERA